MADVIDVTVPENSSDLCTEVDGTIPVEDGVAIHVVLDNYATHKTEFVKRWFARRPRYDVHFTPTGASWLNQVGRFVLDITTKRIRRGVFRSVKALETAIKKHLDAHNDVAKPFHWTATADLILEHVHRVCQRTSQSRH